jgi:hypothetical protein
MRRITWILGVAVVLVFLFAQLHRPDYNRAPVLASATFDSQVHPDAHIRSMLHQSCYNCHSAEGETPWYGRVWPASQLLQDDVRRGRARLDFSNWDNLSPEMSAIRLRDACRMMRESKMPLWYYRPMHPGSTPKPADVDAFCVWAQSQPPDQSVPQLQASR